MLPLKKDTRDNINSAGLSLVERLSCFRCSRTANFWDVKQSFSLLHKTYNVHVPFFEGSLSEVLQYEVQQK